jgi:hypothetical protein
MQVRARREPTVAGNCNQLPFFDELTTFYFERFQVRIRTRKTERMLQPEEVTRAFITAAGDFHYPIGGGINFGADIYGKIEPTMHLGNFCHRMDTLTESGR